MRGGDAPLSWPWAAATWLIVVAVLLDVLALASIWTGRHHSRKAKILWTALVVVLPVLGALGWFLLGRERRRRS